MAKAKTELSFGKPKWRCPCGRWTRGEMGRCCAKCKAAKTAAKESATVALEPAA